MPSLWRKLHYVVSCGFPSLHFRRFLQLSQPDYSSFSVAHFDLSCRAKNQLCWPVGAMSSEPSQNGDEKPQKPLHEYSPGNNLFDPSHC